MKAIIAVLKESISRMIDARRLREDPAGDLVPGDQLQQLPEILDVQQVDPDAAAGAREAFRGSGEAPGG